jgi:hypothetical protein
LVDWFGWLSPLSILSLPLFKTGIFFIDHEQHAFSAYDFAINTSLFNGSFNLHLVNFYLLVPVIYT